MKLQLLIIFSILSLSFLSARSPANLTSNVTVIRNFSSVTATENTFNNARRAEEIQLNIGLNAIANLDLPDQSTWDNFTDGEKMLYLLNDERIARAGINYYGNGPVLGLPFQGIEMGVNGVAQSYAQTLLDNDAFTHTYGGTSSNSRITGAIPSSCQEFINRSENIYAGVSSGNTGFPTAIEAAIFNWNYRDASSNWGHREMCLLQDRPLGSTSGGFNNNNGATDKEGFIGVGIAKGANYAGFGTNWAYGVVVVLNYFDPVSDALAGSCPYDTGEGSETECKIFSASAGAISNCNATAGTYDVEVEVNFSTNTATILAIKFSNLSAFQLFSVPEGANQTQTFLMTNLPADGEQVDITEINLCNTVIDSVPYFDTFTAPSSNCSNITGTKCETVSATVGAITNCNDMSNTYDVEVTANFSTINASFLGIKLKSASLSTTKSFSVNGGDNQTQTFLITGLPANGETVKIEQLIICGSPHASIPPFDTFTAPNNNCSNITGTKCETVSATVGAITYCNDTTDTYDVEVTVNFSTINASLLRIKLEGTSLSTTKSFSVNGGDNQTQTFLITGLPAIGSTVRITQLGICGSLRESFPPFDTYTAPDSSCTNVIGTECNIISAAARAISSCDTISNTYSIEVEANYSTITPSYLSIKLASPSFSTSKSFRVSGGNDQTQTFLITGLPINGEMVSVEELSICDETFIPTIPFDTYTAPDSNCGPIGTANRVHGLAIDSIHACNPQTNTYDLDVAVTFSTISASSYISISSSNLARGQSFFARSGNNQTQVFRLTGLPADGAAAEIEYVTISYGNTANAGVYVGIPFTSPVSCAPTCSDGIKNGNETGIDCGGDQCDPCSICQDDYTITDNPSNGLYQAAQTLQTNGTVTVTDTAIFRAGTSVTLKTGFHAMAGANFSAVIGECEMVVCPSDHTFTANEVTSTTSNYRSVLSIDLDEDMDMDIISSHDKVTWYENDGEESFTPHDITSEIALDLYVEDIDQDGDLDILGAFYFNDQVVWFENNGSQVFTEHIITSTADGVRSVSAKDMDQDGDIDLLSASYFDDKIAWYENDGNENFTAHIITTAADGPYSVEAKDMDGDNDMDIIVGSRDNHKITWHENNGSQNFTTHTVSINANNLFAAYPIDMDNDGDMDILATAYRIIWYENNGTQNFVPHIIEDNDISNYWAAYPADIDADGDVDIFAASYTDDKVLLYENNGKQHFTKHEVDDNVDGASAIYAADIDGDQDIDAIVGSILEDKLTWYNLAFNCTENDTTPASNIPFCQENNPLTAHILSEEAIKPHSVYAIDLDKDGDMDALSASWRDNMVAWYENDGNQNYTIHTIASAMTNVRDVYVDDVDKDGDLDVLSASYAGIIAWYENDGNQNFTAHTISNSDAGSFTIFSIDMDKDGDIDVLSTAWTNDRITWYENNGHQVFTAHTITTTADGVYSVYAIDVDKDGDIDVLSASGQDDKVAWYENDGNQNFTTHTITTAMDGANSVFAIDVDKDGDIDVLSSARAGRTIAWYENNGSQSFTTHILSENATTATGVHADDIDADGDIDIIASASSLFFFENDGNQSFKTHLVAPIRGSLTSAFAADMDNDGDKDILTTGYSSSNSSNAISLYELGCLHNPSNSTNPSITTLSKTINEEVTISRPIVKEKTSSLAIKIAPNPFKEQTTIHYKVPTDTNVLLAIYDLQGKRIKMLQRNSYHTAGNYQINLNLSDYTSGIYFIQLQTQTDYRIEKIVLIE